MRNQGVSVLETMLNFLYVLKVSMRFGFNLKVCTRSLLTELRF